MLTLPEKWAGWLSRITLLACLALFAGKALTSLVQESATWDETHYFGLGKYLLQSGRWDVRGSILHPPLAFYVSALPLFLSESDPALWQPDPGHAKDRTYRGTADVGRGQALLSGQANLGDRLLTQSRSMMVLLALLLGVFVFRWAKLLYGHYSAAAAAILFAFSPNLLAHARLITPDIVVTTFSLIAMYLFWRMLKLDSRKHAVAAGVGLGLALLSKFTALLLLPAMLALACLWGLCRKRTPLASYAMVLLVAFAVLLLGYQFQIEPYVAGILYQRDHALSGQSAFCLGQYSENGWWYYLPLAFVLKTPIALAAMLAAALLLYLRRTPAPGQDVDRLDEFFLLLPAATVVAFFTIEHQSVGLRYILPAYPFLFVFASRLLRASHLGRRWAVPVALAWYVGASTWIHPHYLAYFNELAGGPDRGYRYLVDSNLDWGQDLKGLARFMRERGIAKVGLSYFGSDSPERYGIAYDWLPSMILHNPAPGHSPITPSRYLAISATNLQGVYFPNHALFASLQARTPLTKIGYSIFVYDLGR